MPQDQTDLFGLKKTFKAASSQHRGMNFLAVYLGLAFLVGFLGLVSLAPQVGEKLGTLSAKKQSQESQAAYINPAGPCLPYGDVNYDKLVNATDAQQILQVVAGKIQFKSDPKYADVDANGRVTSVDSLLIQRYTAGLITTFPVCTKLLPSPTPNSHSPYPSGSLPAPSNLQASTVCSSGKPAVVFRWSDTADETNYYVEVNKEPWTAGTWGTRKLTSNTTLLLWTSTSPLNSGNPLIPESNTIYYWRVRAYNSTKNLFSPSVYPPSAQYPPGTPFSTPNCS